MLTSLDLVTNLLGSHFLALRAYCPFQSVEYLVDWLGIDIEITSLNIRVCDTFITEVFDV